MAAFGGTMAHRAAPTYAQPFAAHEIPIVEATPESLKGYGRIETDFPSAKIEITRWPQQGWRPIDDDTGDQGGTTEGVFSFHWKGEVLYGRNDAVGDSYLIGWSRNPAEASETAAIPERERVLVWHANYHPDGGQLFFPRRRIPYIVPLALPGDDIAPEKFVGFYCDGSVGIYFHPGVWHTPALPLAPAAEFDDRQGRVHARVSCNFVEEFGKYLAVPLRRS
jgi:ureidoglycolate lyase